MLATTVNDHLFWITSRAAGTLALLFSSVAVGVGLSMGGKLIKGRGPDLRATHEALSMATIVAIVVHAVVAARRQLPASQPRRHHDPLRQLVHDGLDDDRDRRRLDDDHPRPLVLRARAHRPAALAQAAPLHRARLDPRPGALARRGHRRRQAVVPGRDGDRRAPGRGAARHPHVRPGAPRPAPSHPRRSRDERRDRHRGRRAGRPALRGDPAPRRLRGPHPDAVRRAARALRPPAALQGRPRGRRGRGRPRPAPGSRGTPTTASSCSSAPARRPSTARGASSRSTTATPLGYEQLLIATGSRPRRLALLDGFANVHTLRTLEDARALRAALAEGGRLVIVGAGFIGQEVAAAAAKAGVHTTIVEAADAPLAALLGPAVGTWFADLHRSEGVDVVLGASVAARDGRRPRRAPDPERRPPAGVRPRPRRHRRRPRPRAGWPAAASTPPSSASAPTATPARPGVFAAGDATGGGHWESAARQGVAAARAMLGLESPRPRRRELLERPLRHARALPRGMRAAPTPPRSTATPRGATSASPSPAPARRSRCCSSAVPTTSPPRERCSRPEPKGPP